MDARVLGAISIVLLASLVATEDQLFGGQLPARAVNEAKSFVLAYEKIGCYLETVRSDKVESLVKKVKEIQTMKNRNVLNKIRWTKDQNEKKLKHALALFTSLPKAATLCNFEGYRILAQNYIATKADKQENSYKRSIKVLKHYSQMHAGFCHGKYVPAFQEIARRSPKEATEEFASALRIFEGLRSSDCLVQAKGYGEKLEDFVKTTPICVMQLMRQLLIVRKAKTGLSLAKGESFETTIGVFRGSIKEFLVDPCWMYYDQYKDVFAPALYDATFVNEHEPKMLLAQDGPYGESLQKFRVCESIIKRSDYLQRLIATHLPKGSSS